MVDSRATNLGVKTPQELGSRSFDLGRILAASLCWFLPAQPPRALSFLFFALPTPGHRQGSGKQRSPASWAPCGKDEGALWEEELG